MIGKQILNYRINVFIEEGGMGAVYTGTHTKIGRKVAIKVLHPYLVKVKAIKQRFLNEARTLSVLQHQNIVQLLDYTEDDNSLFLIMEFVDGISLENFIKNNSGKIQEKDAIAIFTQILDAMQYAHEKKIVHRDIKPSNFMVRNDGVVKILDFGIAKILDDKQYNLTQSGAKIGTVMYMSPEQIKGNETSHLSDIYSLGVTLFHLVAGKTPYENAKSEFEIQSEIVHRPLPRATALNQNISKHIEALIDRATAKEPYNRFQTCAEFRKALLSIEKHDKEPVPPPKPDKNKDSNETITDRKTTIIDDKTIIEDTVPHTKIIDNDSIGEEEKPLPKKSKWRIPVFVAAAIVAIIAVFLISRNNSNKQPSDNNDSVEVKDNNTIVENTNKSNQSDNKNQKNIEENKNTENNETTVIDNTDDEKDEAFKPIEPKIDENEITNIPQPNSFTHNFRIIANPEYDFDARQSHIQKFIKNEFLNKNVIVEFTTNGVVTDYYTIYEYLNRIAVNETTTVEIISRKRNAVGKTIRLQVSE